MLTSASEDSAAPVQKDTVLRLDTGRFKPGTINRVTIPIANLYVQVPLEMTVIVLQGIETGPRVLVSAAVHGDEINGIFSIKDLVKAIDPKKLTGTVALVPVVNMFGVINQTRYLPDRRDLNRSFPGSAKGSMAACLAHTFMNRIVKKATHMIDLHTAAIHRTNWPQVRANLDDPETLRLSKAFGANIMIHANERDGSLRQAATKRGMPSILFEGGAALRHNPDAVKMGFEGTMRVLKALAMYDSKVPPPKKAVRAQKSSWIRAEHSGFFVPDVACGDRVKAGETIGHVFLRLHKDFGPALESPVMSPNSGMVIGFTENPMVYQGDALIHVAKLNS